MSHRLGDREERDAGLDLPAGERAAEVVRAAALDLGAGARLGEVAAHVPPRLKQRIPMSLGVLNGVLEERALRGADDRHGAEAGLSLRAAEEDLGPVRGHVLAPGELGLAPAGRGGDDERDASRAVVRELAQELRQLVGRERPLPRLVARGERHRDDFLDAAAPEPGPDGQAERLAQHHELLGDRRVRCTLGAPAGDVAVDVNSPEPLERKGDVLPALVRLEDPDEVARLAPVELDRVRAPPTRPDLLLVQAEEPLQGHGHRRGARGCVIGIGGVALPRPDGGLGGRAVTALGGPDHPLPVLVEPAVPDAPTFEEPLHDSTSLAYFSQTYRGTLRRPLVPGSRLAARRRWMYAREREHPTARRTSVTPTNTVTGIRWRSAVTTPTTHLLELARPTRLVREHRHGVPCLPHRQCQLGSRGRRAPRSCREMGPRTGEKRR